MARAKVIHSSNSCMISFKGNPKSPEPEIGVIKFPGGHVEVTRTTNGKYWAHIAVDDPINTKNSRIDYDFEGYKSTSGNIPDVPYADHIQHIALLIDGPLKDWE